MELRQLRYFVKARELENFTEAAAQLFISQSTLSQQIKQLEDELGTPLFDRVGKYIHVTEAGKLFYDYALQCLQKANDGYQLLKDLGQLQTGHLVIGATYGLRHMLTPALVAFYGQYPQVKVEVIFDTSTELLNRMERFEMDFLLTYEEVQMRKGMKYQPLFESELAFIVRKDSPLAVKKSVTLKEIQDFELALPSKGFVTRRFVDEVFEQHGIVPHINLEISDIPTLLELVGTGHWHSILTHTTVADQHDLVALPIRSVTALQQAAIISLADVYEKKAARAFFEILLNRN